MNMSKLARDPLLAAAKVMIALFVALMIFVLAMLGIGLGAILTVQRGELLADVAAAGAPPSAYWAIVAVFPLIGGIMYALLRFALELGGIVRSVDEGDPFQPQNADRLSRMGWLTVSVYVLGLLVAPLAAWLASVTEKTDFAGSLDLGGGGIFLILVLFILARVFRRGAEMRADLEGTV